MGGKSKRSRHNGQVKTPNDEEGVETHMAFLLRTDVCHALHGVLERWWGNQQEGE